MTGAEIETDVRTSRDGSLLDRVTAQLHVLLGVTARKTYLALADQSVVSGTRFFTTLMIGRLCGADSLGIYSLAFTLMILILGAQQALVCVPYTVYGNRLKGTARAECAGSAIIHAFMLSVTAMMVLFVIAVLLSVGIGPPGLAPLVWLLLGVMPFALLQDLARRFAFAHLNMGTALILDLVVAIIQIGGLVLLAVSGALSPVTAYAVLGLGCAVSGVAWLGRTRRDFVVRREAVIPALKQNWSFGKWVFGALTTSMMNGYIMYWFVAIMLGTTATGLYAACMTVLLFANPFLMGIGNVFTPRAARAFAEGGNRELRRVVFKTTLLQGAVMTLFCTVIVLFGGQLVHLLYRGSEYAGHGTTVAVLALGFLAGALSLGVFDGLMAIERPDVNFKTDFLGLIVKLSVAAALVSHWGILGAAAGSLAGSAVMSVLRWVIFLRLVESSPSAGTSDQGDVSLAAASA